MDISECYKIGYIAKPHGLKGEVTIALDPQIPNDVSTLDAVFIQENDSLVPYFITDISVQANKAYVKLEDINSLEAAQDLAKKSLYLPKTARPKPEPGGFYEDEILGFHVTDEALGDLGVIADVMTAGPNRLLVMDYEGKEVLIPINSPFITNVDKSKNKITVNLPEGFLDI